LLAWMQTLAFDDSAPARRWEPKRLRFRLLAVAGRIIRTGRRRLLRLPRSWPWDWLIETGWTTLRTVLHSPPAVLNSRVFGEPADPAPEIPPAPNPARPPAANTPSSDSSDEISRLVLLLAKRRT